MKMKRAYIPLMVHRAKAIDENTCEAAAWCIYQVDGLANFVMKADWLMVKAGQRYRLPFLLLMTFNRVKRLKKIIEGEKKK